MVLHAESRTRLMSVLLVDDDRDTLQLYSDFLRFSGVRVWTAGSTPAAFSSARRHHPDVVVTDIALPGDDGWTLCRLLRDDEDTRACSVIALTGWVHDTRLSERAEQAGVDLVLTKPCLPDALLEQIGEVRRRAQLVRVRGRRAIIRAEHPRARSDRLAANASAIHNDFGRTAGRRRPRKH
jgi:two-component system, cell cycle response regulator DivK